ncbi:hypothetical protein ANCDUO_06904 [Ancylostoma duodenale]|uniref:Uncharacterized protein n=1 Tax=Ancylostoma duodenale TaxID=51022 RepID=A0A0C2GNF0_9BILA|nr:hypothetical protein ANCDUO_06904 [Ancylostoma duodenale]
MFFFKQIHVRPFLAEPVPPAKTSTAKRCVQRPLPTHALRLSVSEAKHAKFPVTKEFAHSAVVLPPILPPILRRITQVTRH